MKAVEGDTTVITLHSGNDIVHEVREVHGPSIPPGEIGIPFLEPGEPPPPRPPGPQAPEYDVIVACYLALNGKYLAKVVRENSNPAQTFFLHADMVGSIRAITDSAGEVVARFEHEPFGLLTMSTGPMAAGAHRFTGKPEDGATERYYFGARYYDPGVGRFTSGDPARQGLNWHTYCANNPLNRVDSDGNSWSSWLGNLGEAVAQAWYVLNAWEIVWTTNGHGPNFSAFDAATKQFALVDAKAWLSGGTVSKLVWATGDNLKNWSTEIWNAVKDSPGLSKECIAAANKAIGPAGEWGKNVSKHIVE